MTLWSGRFAEAPSEVLWQFTVDTADRRLLVDDVAGSLAHAEVLGEIGLIDPSEAAALASALGQVLDEARTEAFVWEEGDEDVHSAVERRLGELIGDLAGKLHTGRSRNDQVALDLRLYLRRSARARSTDLATFAAVLADRAEEVADVVVASYTHLQQAQPISLGHHLMAYAWMALRDAGRFDDVARRLAVSPLGAGASAGSSLPLAPERTAELLGFASSFDNSMDAVASRDLVAEFAFAAGQAMTNLSRLAEDVILWATSEFGWVTMSDALSTGSSALPQKKNPDIAELVRGRAASVIGDVTTLLTLQKGLPLTYNRDLQEDKRAVFHADDVLVGSLEALGVLMATAEFHPPAPDPSVAALDLAEVLVERGVPFRTAHDAIGALVGGLARDGRSLDQASAEDLAAAHPLLGPDDVDLVDTKASVVRRQTSGGGSVASVQAQVARLRQLLG